MHVGEEEEAQGNRRRQRTRASGTCALCPPGIQYWSPASLNSLLFASPLPSSGERGSKVAGKRQISANTTAVALPRPLGTHLRLFVLYQYQKPQNRRTSPTAGRTCADTPVRFPLVSSNLHTVNALAFRPHVKCVASAEFKYSRYES